MKRIVLSTIVCLTVATLLVAQEKTDTTATAPKPADSPLVKAAKAAGGPKRKPKSKVLTNADVKKSKGKLTILSPKSTAAVTATSTAPAEPPKGLIEKHAEQLREAKEAAERVDVAQKKVSELEKELRTLEDEYYAENDPNYRDNTLAPRFNQTKRQLEEARKVLADARDAQEKVQSRKPAS